MTMTSTSRGARLPAAAYLLALVALAGAVRSPTLVHPPFIADEATYATIGTEIAGGELLYRDVVDQKPPGIYYIYAAVGDLFGHYNLAALHLVSFVVVAITGLLLAMLASDLLGANCGRLAGVLYVVVGAMGKPQDVQPANAELFMNLAIAAALVSCVRARRSGRTTGYALTGLLLAIGILVKFQAAFVLPGILLYILLTPGRRLVPSLLVAAASAAPLVALAALYARLGAFADLAWMLKFNKVYSTANTIGYGMAKLVEPGLTFLASNLVLIVPAVYFAVAAPRDEPAVPRGARALLTSWLVLSLLAAGVGARFSLHYFLQLVPPLAVMAAFQLRAWSASRPVVLRVAAAFLAAGAIASLVAAFMFPRFWPGDAAQNQRYEEVGQYVRSHTADTDRIFVWGSSPEIYVTSRRRTGARYLWNNYQIGRMWGTPSNDPFAPGDPGLAFPETWAPLLEDLDRRKPLLVVDGCAGRLNDCDGHPIGRYPLISRFVEDRYRLEATVLGVPIYRARR